MKPRLMQRIFLDADGIEKKRKLNKSKSAIWMAVQRWYRGTDATWLLSVVGPKAPRN
jgi:hypothetical protein